MLGVFCFAPHSGHDAATGIGGTPGEGIVATLVSKMEYGLDEETLRDPLNVLKYRIE